MKLPKHVVFVETNNSGIIGLETALALGHKVSFIYSISNKELYHFRKIEALFPKLLKVIVCEDTFNCKKLWETVELLNQFEKIDAILTVLEYCVEATAAAAERLGLPGLSGEIASRARNKSEVRKLLQSAGIASCKNFEAEDIVSLKKGLEALSFPVVTKPSRGAASLFVRVCHCPEEAFLAWAEFFDSKTEILGGLGPVISDSLLVEEYLQGRMISAEVGLSQEEFRLFTIGERKRAQRNEVVELGTTMPAPLTDCEWASVEEYAASVLRLLEMGSGVYHLEIMMTLTGPVLIELNPRLMGGSLPKVYNFTYRTNIYERLIEAHLGEKFGPPAAPPSDSVTSRIFGSIEEKSLADTFDLEWEKEFAANDLQYDLYCKPSDKAKILNSNLDYLGALRLRAETHQESGRMADLAVERLEKMLGTKLAK
jgi:predicted ATP-grasp superfamily ATP-dependent carboligase